MGRIDKQEDAGRTPRADASDLSACERRSRGKALRDATPRAAQAGWKPPKGRRDPVEIVCESSVGRLDRLVPVRYGRMSTSPFAFYRGAAALMAADLAPTPTSGIRVQACGDAHLILGWTRTMVGRDVYVRQLRDLKMSANIEGADAALLRNYGRRCALARAHARSGDAAMMSGCMGSGRSLTTRSARSRSSTPTRTGTISSNSPARCRTGASRRRPRRHRPRGMPCDQICE